VSELFIALYLDEDVTVLVAELLRARGFVARTTVAAGQRGASDAAQLAYAAGQNMALLTHNRVDFETLAQQWFVSGQAHAGIIVAVRHPPYELVRRLLLILNHVTADEMRDQIRYI
jgi:hypothetical protein